MAEGSYNQFCPVAMAAEDLCTRWTPVLLLREMMAGSKRFNDLRRGLPRMSPALLSSASRNSKPEASSNARRLRRKLALLRLPAHARRQGAGADHHAAFGVWGQRWVESALCCRTSMRSC